MEALKQTSAKLNRSFLTTGAKIGPRIPAPSVSRGQEVSVEVQRKIRASILSGSYPKIGSIAKQNGVSVSYVKSYINNDPELKKSYEAALLITAEQIEQAAVDMCLDDSINAVAREKMIEFCLPKMMPEKYGEQASLLNNGGQGIKRIAILPIMPVVAVDADGIPIKQNQESHGEVIDVG